MTRRRRQQRRARAQSMVEFACALPVFLVLLLGFIDFSRLLFTYVALTNGAREMARSLSIAGNSDAVARAAFTNTSLMLASVNNTADTVVITVYDPNGTVVGVPTTCYLNTGVSGLSLTLSGSSTVCPLPSRLHGGSVQVDVSYAFQFTPLFQGPLGTGLVRSLSRVTTTTRTFVE